LHAEKSRRIFNSPRRVQGIDRHGRPVADNGTTSAIIGFASLYRLKSPDALILPLFLDKDGSVGVRRRSTATTRPTPSTKRRDAERATAFSRDQVYGKGKARLLLVAR
jgi:hypothetical protein